MGISLILHVCMLGRLAASLCERLAAQWLQWWLAACLLDWVGGFATGWLASGLLAGDQSGGLGGFRLGWPASGLGGWLAGWP